MSLSKSKSKTTSQETVGPNAAYAPNINDAASTFRPAYDAQQAAAQSFAPGLQKAGGFFSDTLDGKFLNGNPHLQGVIDSSNRDITDSVNSNFMSRFGSGYHTNALVDRLSQNEGRLRYGDYATERGYQNEAGGNLAGIAGAATALPGVAAGQYAENTGGLLGRYMTSNGTSTTKSKGSLISQLAKAAQVAATVASDRRLKMDIVKIGEDADGLGRYEYRYVTDAPDAPLRQGVMADEVALLRPWALGPERNGFKTVDYGALA